MKLPWIFRMALRDSRRNRSRLLLFMGSITAGIAALVAIYSFGYDLQRNVDEQAATLLGADVQISTNQKPSVEGRRFLDSLPAATDRSEEEQLGSMVLFTRTGDTRFTQIRALRGAYPYYGDLETTPIKAAGQFQQKHEALVEKALMLQYNIHVGDSVQVGNRRFRIAGSLDNYPGGNGFSTTVAPPVMIPLDDIDSTGLNQLGTRSQYLFYYRLKPGTDVQALHDDVQRDLEDHHYNWTDIPEKKRNTGRIFDDLGRFMSLVAFLALLLGCIGVSSAIQIYIREKTATIAVMRCLGVTVRRAFLVYLIQVAGIGLLGALIGALLGVGVQQLLPRVFKDVLPLTIHTALSWSAIGQGLVLGLVMALVFGLLPLLSIRRITPLYTLRSSYEASARSKDPWRWPVYILVLLFVFVFTLIQLREFLPTLSFTLGLLVAFGLLTLAGRVLMALLKRVTRSSWSFAVRQGFANLYRPNNQTLILVVSIGLSTALVCSLLFIQQVLVHQLVISSGKSQANMVLLDVQPKQVASVDSLIRAQGLPIVDDIPVVSVRFTSIRGTGPAEEGPLNWAMNTEHRITYRDHLTNTESITGGRWTGHAGGSPVPVSFDDRWAKSLGLQIGDTVVFNVQGAPLTAIVGSFRKVEWNRLQSNFHMVFPTGVLEQAPQFHVLTTRTGSAQVAARARTAIARGFPTVSVIDLGLVLSVLDELLDKINYVIHFLAAFSMITGLIVLIASVRNSKYQRIQESVLLRTLGAGRRLVFSINALEYLFLGFVSGLTGILLALAASYLQARFLFKLSFVIGYWQPLALLGVVCLLTMAIGLFNSRGVLNRSTLEVLRNEV